MTTYEDNKYNIDMESYILLEEKKQKRLLKKIKLIDLIIDNFIEDPYTYKKVMIDLCREALMTRKNNELKKWL